ncbi:chemosensory pili system protein ChpA (sensor histidine kinase/response regulator) [Dyella sp. OK004]|uniref:Hpt domain-containing protein n=1 Tax=Dyella sp. OK004 TaxID=1855292 RepID=UPI0008E054EB|nr:Hpt domain-containing protein [Dyella sp. OK004]SFS06435.1 chemosensory pili system protein ChpA (sensor histidine kinase/response regulator) [Dyella sp. OK004]
MRLQDHIDFTTLQWVKPELDETLAIAREALESYVDNPGNRDVMRACADHLHQVQGTLRMVELYGAALVAEEMETLAISLMEDHVAQREEAYAAMMRGLMQLPDYLERLSGGHRDVPVVLLPLLNDLRASRGQQALHESALFSPNLEAVLPDHAPAAMNQDEAERAHGQIAELRLRFQQQLLAWFRGQSPEHQLAAMVQTLDGIAARCYSIPGRRLWWIAAGVLEGLQQGTLKSQAGEVRQLIGKVDRSIRQLIEQGESSMRGSDADELARKLLYVVAQSKQRSPRMDQLAQAYSLDALLPDASELEHARGSMSGHNRALLDSVAKALKDDLLRVKEALDLFLRQTDADPAQLTQQTEILERVGDTLGMLALGVPRRVVNEQRRVLEDIASRMRAPDEELLLDVAGALLYVEASLDDHIESLGADEETIGEAPVNMLPRSEARHILATLMQEATANTGKVKEAIVAFVESGWHHQQLTDVPGLMDEVAGAMRMLTAPRPAELADGIGRFVGNELLSDRRVPTSAQMDHLADALAALEYYLEAAREHRGGLEHILDVAEHSLSTLGYWPPPPARTVLADVAEVASAPAPALHVMHDFSGEPALSESVSLAHGADLGSLVIGEAATPTPSAHELAGLKLVDTEHTIAQTGGSDESDWIEIEEEIVEQVPVAGAVGSDAGFHLGAEGIDDDIREIFLEEMQEEIDNLRSAQQTWLADPQQIEALIPIRRSFHTLKGSGRLVGASVLGEYAWKVENMLNRVLDHSIQPTENVQALVRHAIEALPPLRAALMGENMSGTVPLAAIMDTAERLGAGQENASIADHAPAATETVRRVVKRRVPRVGAAADAIPAASLASIETSPAPAIEPRHDVIAAPVMPPVDPVLLEILRSEVAQYLQTIRHAINRVDGELRVDDGLLRAVHTLHGAIAMVDIPVLTQLLSPLESLLKRLRAAGQPLSTEGVNLLGKSADAVDHIMTQFDVEHPQLPDLDALIHRITELRDGQPEPQVAHVVFEPHLDDLSADTAEDEGALAAALDAAMPVHPTAHEAVGPAAGETPAMHAEPATDDFTAELMAALGEFDAEAGVPDTSALDEEALHDSVAATPAAPQDDEDDFAALYGDLIDEPLEPVTELEVPEDETPAHHEEPVHHVAAPVVEDDAVEAPHALLDAESAAESAHVAEVPAETHAPVEEPAHPVIEPVAEVVHEAPIEETVAHVAPVEAETESAVSEYAATWTNSQIDPDLLEIFIEEAREILDHSDSALAQWRAEPSEMEHMASVQRDLHTLKGGARIAGMVPVGDLTHAIETLLESPVGHDPSRVGDLIGALESGFDQLHVLVQRVSQGRGIEYPQAMIDHFLGMAGETASLAEEHVVAMPPAPQVDLPELLPEEGQQDDGRAPQEQIRVRAELLDTLVNHAGEVAIYRSRLEQQVAGYRFNLVELDQTVQRLRSQLRMMEIETEAQIIARFQREHREAGLSVFDPLELDRYSQLQQYSRALAESVSDLVQIQSMLDELTRQAETLLLQQSRVSSELQDGLLRTRMLPFDTMVPNLRRTLRQAAQEQGKGAQLFVEGAHGEMDRNLLDRIKAPFEHMLRNAVAHGIESPEERQKAGKPTEGSVRIRVAREATEVVVRVTDDGRGLDREAVRKRGIERGMLRADTKPSDDQLLALITQPGFSTASSVTQLAGRGVGMDVVANEIKQLGGSLSIESQQGQGTTFVLRLPFTLAVTQAILVRIGEGTFAIPMTSVQGVARISPSELAERLAEPEPSFQYGGEQYGIHDLAELLGIQPGHPGDEQVPLLLTRAGDLRAAIRIDAVIGSREIVVKSVGPQISSVPGILGATIMGDGSVLIILDLAPLVRHGIVRRQERLAEGLSAVQAPVVEEVRVRPLVMVVDDSITMRKVTGRVLERHEYEVSTAKDGVDAVEKLHERVPDLMLLDIEMPRMDGFELATHMKADPRLRGVPIIMITSRTGDKHRQRAFDIGVDRYLGKPYQEAELLMQISEVLEQRALQDQATESANG